jgi:hypothetical protein
MGAGSELSEAYYRRVVAPALASRWPGLRYAAGRLGSGSDVLGYDDQISRDHDWGLRLSVLVAPDMTDAVREHLQAVVPAEFEGLPTRPELTWVGEPALAVDVTSPDAFALARLGVEAAAEWSVDDWVSFTGQAVLEIRGGPIFSDTEGALVALRERLEWYPDEVWRWAVAAGWFALSEELPFVGRAGERGDDLGSRVIAARLARVAMHLGFLLTRTWPPYSKWIGTAFAQLPHVDAVRVNLEQAVKASAWQERQQFLGSALEELAAAQRSAGLPTGDVVVEPFFDRPYLGVAAATHELLLESVTDPGLRGRRLAGVVEQWCQSVPALVSPSWRRERA